jgi:hypothetical protein
MMNQPVGPVHAPPRLTCYGGGSKNNNFLKKMNDGQRAVMRGSSEKNTHTLFYPDEIFS